jgi:hypothetical protein
MKVVDIANEIYLENAQPADTSVAAIAFWIRSNIGKLNTLLYENFWIDPNTLEIVSSTQNWANQPAGSQPNTWEIGALAANILKMMYKVYRIELDIRANLNAINNDTILMASDEGFIVKKINRSEILKTLTSQKKDTLKELQEVVHYYRSYHAVPSQVYGDDTVAGHYPEYISTFGRQY